MSGVFGGWSDNLIRVTKENFRSIRDMLDEDILLTLYDNDTANNGWMQVMRNGVWANNGSIEAAKRLAKSYGYVHKMLLKKQFAGKPIKELIRPPKKVAS
jgi:hypothetical protein